MKFHHPLNDILGSRSKVAILRLLASGDRTLTGRQIAMELKMSVWACHQSLQELAAMGILLMKNHGGRYTFKLIRDTYVARECLLPLFQKEADALEAILEKALKEIRKHCLSAILYGSVARGEEQPFSDVDILLVTETKRDASRVRSLFRERWFHLVGEFGNNLSPYILTRNELIQKESTGLPLFENIRAEGKVLFGLSLPELVRDAA